MGFHRSECRGTSTGVAEEVAVSAGNGSKRRNLPVPHIDVCHYTDEGGSIALTATTVARQCDLVRFSQKIRATKTEILWSNGPWLGKEIGLAWENFYETRGFPPFVTL